MDKPAAGRELRDLKARAQRLQPILYIGKEGVTDSFFKSLDEALTHHELVKVRFGEFKEQKKQLTPLVAEKTNSQIILRVGNVLVLFRRRPPETAD